MKITIIRHGKVNMEWKHRYNSEQFDKDCQLYDDSSILPPENIVIEPINSKIYISTLKRTSETSQALFGAHETIKTPLLNEVPLRSFCSTQKDHPLWMWNVFGRLQWSINQKRQPEGKNETRKRAQSLIHQLEAANEDCILISHGFFMRTLIHELKRSGFHIEQNNSFCIDNMARITATKQDEPASRFTCHES